MQVKLKSNLFNKSIGTTINVSRSVGEQLIKSGDAEAVIESVIEPKPKRKHVSNKAMTAPE